MFHFAKHPLVRTALSLGLAFAGSVTVQAGPFDGPVRHAENAVQSVRNQMVAVRNQVRNAPPRIVVPLPNPPSFATQQRSTLPWVMPSGKRDHVVPAQLTAPRPMRSSPSLSPSRAQGGGFGSDIRRKLLDGTYGDGCFGHPMWGIRDGQFVRLDLPAQSPTAANRPVHPISRNVLPVNSLRH